MKNTISQEFTDYYKNKKYDKIYPSEFVVRTFLASYPRLNMMKPKKDDTVIDVSCGYGRNLLFLCEQGYKTFATEATQEICDETSKRMKEYGYNPEILVGKNHCLPFEDEFADYVLAAYCSYYCDEGVVMSDNVKEYSRILKKGGWLVTSIMCHDMEMVRDSKPGPDGTSVITNDIWNVLNGYRVFAVYSTDEIKEAFSTHFVNFSFGRENCDFFGFEQNQFWVVCQKRG